ncbi:acetylcholine receptor subunit beta-like [Fopius arisanus]|nr:PREDICTED: acetylcholine receptor subunit beta-like [Fopius arisanus]
MILRLVFADYHEEKAELELHTRVHIVWTDSFLNWRPSDFDGIESIHVKMSQIWKPEIYSLNPKDDEFSGIPDSSCVLTNDGKISCRPTRVFTAPCESNYTHWPYDTHKCTIKIGAPTYTSNEVLAGKGKSGIFIRHYNSHPQWRISIGSVRHSRIRSKISRGDTFESIGVSFLLDRPYTSLKSVVVSPIIILAVVTLTILWLTPGTTERLVLSCLNIIGHLITIRNVNFNIPDTGTTVPNILIFYNNSMIFATIALVVSCWLQKLVNTKREVPTWVAGPVAAILITTPGKFCSMTLTEPKAAARLRDDEDSNSLVDSDHKTADWEGVVTVLSWIFFITFAFIYIVMCVILL